MEGLSGNGSGICGRSRGRDSPLGYHRQLPIRRLPFHAECLYGAFDVLQRKAAKIVKRRLHPASHGFMDGARDHNATCWRFPFQPGRHVDAVAIEIVTIDDQVAQVQAHAEDKRGVGRRVAVGLGHGLAETR